MKPLSITFKKKLNDNELYNNLTHIIESQQYLYKETGGKEIFNIAGISSIQKAIENDFQKLGLKLIHKFDDHELLILNNKLYKINDCNIPKSIQELINIHTNTNRTKEHIEDNIKRNAL